MTDKFNAQAAEGLNAIYLFKIEGESSYSLKIANGKFELNEVSDEASVQANVTLGANKQTWESIISGGMPAQMAFMMGKLQASGDLPLALKLPKIFSLGGN